MKETTGLVYVNGRVRGYVDGYIDANVQGFIRGDVQARMEIGERSQTVGKENAE